MTQTTNVSYLLSVERSESRYELAGLHHKTLSGFPHSFSLIYFIHIIDLFYRFSIPAWLHKYLFIESFTAMSSQKQQGQSRKRPLEEESNLESSQFNVAEAIASQLQMPPRTSTSTTDHRQNAQPYQNPAGNSYLTIDPNQAQHQPFEGPVWDDILLEVKANDVCLKEASILLTNMRRPHDGPKLSRTLSLTREHLPSSKVPGNQL